MLSFKPEDRLVGSVSLVNNLEIAESATNARHQAIDRARAEAAQFIANANVTETRHEFHTEYRLEVYVLSPSELHELIQAEALRLSRAIQHTP